MGTEQDNGVEQSLVELLAVAKLWMPDLLFEIEPRVHRARQLVATLGQVSGSRPPSIIAELSDELPILDLSPPATMESVERMRGAEPPPWDISAGIDAFMASDLALDNRTEAVIFMLRDWLIGHGYIDPAPEPEETH